MTELPKDPVGQHPLVDWMVKIRRCIQERTILPGSGAMLSYTQQGTRIQIDRKRESQATNFRWRGEWESGTPTDGLGGYIENDIVIRGGPTSPSNGRTELANGLICSTFVAVSDISPNTLPPEDPSLSGDWEMLARSSFPRLTIVDRDSASTAEEISALKRISLNGIANTANPGNVSIDINALRGWPASFREVEVCVAGETKFMMVLCTQPYDTRGQSAPSYDTRGQSAP